MLARCVCQGEMWIYMEHMMISLDGMYKMFLEIKPKGHVIPEQVMGVIAVSVLRGLDYLYEAHRVMHRGTPSAQAHPIGLFDHCAFLRSAS